MSLPSILMTLGAFLLVLGPLVILHELGHYLVGRWFGVRADAFSFGFGKELAGWTDRRGTRWKISAIPDGRVRSIRWRHERGRSARPQARRGNTGWDRCRCRQGNFPRRSFVAAGLDRLCRTGDQSVGCDRYFAAFAMAYGVRVTPPVIGGFAPNSAAQAAGFQVGDRIIEIDGTRIDDFTQIARQVMLYPGHTVTVVAARGGQTFTRNVTIAAKMESDGLGTESKRGLFGVSSVKPELVRVGPLKALETAVYDTGSALKTIVVGLGQIITGERSAREMGGPIKIAQYSGQQMALGWASLIWFTAMISINLAFINLLPIPVLDGGHLAMYAAEAIRRKPLGARSQEWAFRAGLAFVLALVLFSTFNDLAALPFFRS